MPTLSLISWIKLGAVALIMALVVGMYAQNSHLKAKIAQQTARVLVLESALKEQNEAVQKLKDDASVRKKNGDLEVAKAQRDAAVAIQGALNIRNKRPSTPGDDYKSALDLGNGK